MIRNKKRSLRFERLEWRALLAADIALTRYFETWSGSTIRSTDPADIAYHAPSGHLFLADSEINEMSQYFVGDNIFEISTRGDTVYRRYASKNTEPTGITYNPFDGFFYVTNDDTKLITRYDSNLNTPLKTVDTRTATSTAKDPEGIAADPETGTLYVSDGVGGGKQVLVYNSNLVFQYRFPIGAQVKDGEGIAFDPISKNLFVVSSPDMAVFEYTTAGAFITSYDLSSFNPRPVAPQGAVFAPTSNPTDDPNLLALYIADGMSDNHPSGRVYETMITRGDSGGGGGGGGGGGEEGDVQILESRIAAGSDDAEEKSSGSVATSNGDLELVYDGNNQIVGLRFRGITIPQGASIVDAYVQFQVDESSSGSSSLTIQGQAIDNAGTFTTQTRNVSSRARTSNSVHWTPPTWNTVKAAGPDQRTPNLSPILQELVDRPGWTSGNSLALIISGTGRRVAESFEGGASYAPRLIVQYRIGPPPGNVAPLVSAGPDQSIALGNVLSLDGTVTDSGGPSPLTTNWSLFSGPGTVSFGNAAAVDTTATFSKVGSYELQLSAFDGEFTQTDNVTVQVTGPSVDVRVAAGSDDAEEKPTGAVDLSSSDLELIFDGANQIVGLRFNGITVPQGATIVNAYIQFEVDESTTTATSLTIQGQAADNPTTFTKTTRDISNRPRTAESVSWVPAAWPTVGAASLDQRTPNIASVVQKLVNRPGWNSGNSMVMIITGTGKRVAEAFNGKASAAPLLHIEYALSAAIPMAAPIMQPSVSSSKKATASTGVLIAASTTSSGSADLLEENANADQETSSPTVQVHFHDPQLSEAVQGPPSAPAAVIEVRTDNFLALDDLFENSDDFII